MLETLIAFIKTFPAWLFHLAEVLIVAVVFATCVIFMWGVVVGIKIVRGKADDIEEITVLPPSIKFKSDD